jgi:energy-coupling factor transport system permease protein
VVAGALINTRERAIALEVRGFDHRARKIFLTDRPRQKTDIVITFVLALALTGAIGWRIRLWLI